MAEQKTKPTAVKVSAHLDAITDLERRDDCWKLVDIMHRVTGEEPLVWGPSMIGFGVSAVQQQWVAERDQPSAT